MPFKNIDELGRQLLRLHLVDQTHLDQHLAQLPRSAKGPEALIESLEGQGLLTPFQVTKLKEGETDGLVLGGFKLLYRNASGSFARIFRAASLQDGRMVGLKLLRQRWAKDPKMVQQFRREAELGKRLKHKNIVPIYDVGSEGESHFFTMEFVEGGNFRDFINIRKKLAPAEATQYVLDMAEGLQYALGMRMTHRDLKLTNVLMSATGVAKLVDFGLAGAEDISGSIGGDGQQRALEYATLEKATGAPIDDPRSDLYFLGGIFYELVTGVPPYPRTRDRDERKQITRYTNIRPLRSHDPNIPRQVVDIVERLMKISPDQRYQSPGGVIVDLRQTISELGPYVPGGTAAASRPQAGDTRGLPTVLCVENRAKQQDMLREYLTKHGFRVLVLSDVERTIARLKSNPPDCAVLMGEAIGPDVVSAFNQAAALSSTRKLIVMGVLSEKQLDLLDKCQQSPTARILLQPITLRNLRKEIHVQFQKHKMHFKEADEE